MRSATGLPFSTGVPFHITISVGCAWGTDFSPPHCWNLQAKMSHSTDAAPGAPSVPDSLLDVLNALDGLRVSEEGGQQDRLAHIQQGIEALAAENAALKHLAQEAFAVRCMQAWLDGGCCWMFPVVGVYSVPCSLPVRAAC